MLILTFAATDEIADRFNDFRKGVYFVGNGEFKSLLNFPFELFYLILILSVQFARPFRSLAVHLTPAVDKR